MDPQSDVIYEFTLPKAGPKRSSGGMPLTGWGATETRDDVKVRVRRGGNIEFVAMGPDGAEERVTPTSDELAMVKEMLAQREKEQPQAARAPPPQTPNEQRIEAAQATITEANARKAAQPDTITRTAPTPGTNAAVDDPRAQTTEQVSLPQATYDRQVQADQRQAQIDLQQRAEAAESAAVERARLAIQKDQMTAAQAHQKLQDDLKRIDQDIQREQNAQMARGQEMAAATARRGQDLQLQSSREGNQVSMRGQDVSAGVSQRGQDLGYEQSLVGDTVQMANVMANHAAPLWQIAQVDATTRGKWGDQIPAMQPTPPMFGTDPTAFVTNAAQAARQNNAPRYVLPGADQYRLPG